jgi:hypothetical protein
MPREIDDVLCAGGPHYMYISLLDLFYANNTKADLQDAEVRARDREYACSLFISRPTRHHVRQDTRSDIPQPPTSASRKASTVDPSKEKGVALGILLDSIGIILLWIILLPRTHGIDMLLALVPTTVHNLCSQRIVMEAFELFVGYLVGPVLLIFFVTPCEGVVR